MTEQTKKESLIVTWLMLVAFLAVLVSIVVGVVALDVWLGDHGHKMWLTVALIVEFAVFVASAIVAGVS